MAGEDSSSGLVDKVGGGTETAAQNTAGIKLSSGPLTVKGSPMNSAQQSVANALLTVGKQLNAPTNALVAIIVAAIFENSIGLGTYGNNPTRQGPLSPPVGSFPGTGLAQATEQATSFFKGGNHFNSAISAAPSTPDPNALAEYAEGAEGQYEEEVVNGQKGAPAIAFVEAEAQAIVTAFGGGQLPGGTSGSGSSSTGTTTDASFTTSGSSPQAPFTLGTSASPTQDMWTAINSIAQDRQWYIFSDGETVYLADGADLMQQTPAMSLDRWGDSGKILHLDFSWDNTAFSYTTNRIKSVKRVQRKSVLQKVASPVEATLDVVCDIDAVRGGDVIALSSCGPADGKWLVSDATRSVFEIYTECTLVPAVAALSEQEAAGAGSNTLTGAAASRPGSGTVIAAMISAASTINNAKVSYVYGGGHAQAGTISIGKPGGPGYNGVTKGYDCSGAVGAVLAAGGLLSPGSPVPSNDGIISELQGAGQLSAGAGTGTPSCTLYNGPNHIFMALDGQFFGTSDGGGTSTSGGGSGGAWLTSGSDVSTFTAYHVSASLLNDPVVGSPTTTSGGTAVVNAAGGTNPVPSWSPSRIDQGCDGTLTSKGYLAPYQCQIIYPGTPGGDGWGTGSNAFIVAKLLDGPNAGNYFYVAEGVNLAAGLSAGSVLQAGQQMVVRVVSSYNGILGNIETGWIDPSDHGSATAAGETLARSLAGYGGDQSVQAITAGSAMNSFITSLGASPSFKTGAGVGVTADPSLLPAGNWT